MKQYTKMKDSGIEWIGEIPEEWGIKKIKRHARVMRGASPRPIDDPKFFDENGKYAWVRISDVTSSKGLLKQTTETLSDLGSSLSVKLTVGELFLSIAGSVGKQCITEIPCCIHDGFVYFPVLKLLKKYLYFIFEGGECYKGLGKLGTQLNLNTETIGNIVTPYPPENIQKLIIDYLEKQTTKIDSEIEKSENLVTLLQEKRQAIINHTITKGLDNSIPMKDSGIEWIGEIPEGWKLTKLIWDFKNIGSGTTPKKERNYYVNGTVSWVNSGDLNDSFIDSTKNLLNQSVLNDYSILKLFPKNTVIIAMYGATIGKLGILKEEAITNQACCNLSNSTKIDFKFLFYWFLAFRKIIISFAEGGGQPNINMELIKSLRLFYPSKKEQKQLVDFLDKQTMHMDKLISKAKLQIKTLQEYRQSLISSAVTGKIDVREAIT
jgi:type I restriction enzyme, S subunit